MEDASPRPKQAACLVCRRSKVKCEWTPPDRPCKRCVQLGSECVRPSFHAGRQKGIKNKRVGLDKALYQVEQAVSRARAGDAHSAEEENALDRLRDLLAKTTDSREWPPPSDAPPSSRADTADSVHDDSPEAAPVSGFVQSNDDGLGVDDAENPLELLARVSYIQPSRTCRRTESTRESERQQDFFTSARVSLDIGSDIDPISLGLVTDAEADGLFSFFHSKLAHTRWGLDSRIYTVSHVRSRSAFLCTSLMAAAALFMPDAAALSKRLSNHVKTLAHRVMVQRHRSVEIVLAFMVNIPWMFPGKHSTDDEACVYISLATSIAIDLSLHKIIVPLETLEQGSRLSLTRGDCLDTRAALAIDGLANIDPLSETGRLLLRGRERCWISLFVLERGMSLARGRPFMVPVTRLIKDCDNWHLSAQADPQDGHLVSMAVLRRNLEGLFDTVRSLCDGCQHSTTDGSLIAQSIQTTIERFFDQWLTEWGASIGIGPGQQLPPYVEILVTHTRLSTYGGVINHPTAPLQVGQFFRRAGLSSALNVMRAAIRGESQLASMPNNTAIMISFAACFALKLSAHTTTENSTLAPSVRKLIDETAGVLERIGTVTAHRNGLSLLYGQHLRSIVQKAAAAGTGTRREPRPCFHPDTEPAMTAMASVPPQATLMAPTQLLWSEPLQLSSMSDDQITRVLDQPGNEVESSFVGGLSWEDMHNFGWVHWPQF
ncbi:hypothetical protein CDD81_1424 [Ophiocordyceps australis]|uniref:Zn(2)-C6 fungal-type domain-containing protein n=1 Tax=Ophiocordyceps australis TaxID=1399860 RepID=A0A2C5XVW9_9HYPO|nr:hypothetical protein CDD81_1424 [Ophiocordyceps australis]